MEVLTMIIRTYRELIRLKTFEERYDYLKLSGVVGESTFGFDRYLNQLLYTSKRWRRTRNDIILRDNACDLGMEDYEVNDLIIIHHMNPITPEDIELDRDLLYDPDNLISSSKNTHRAIHFGDKSMLPKLPIERRMNDTCPWK
jgi:hypothetical protein